MLPFGVLCGYDAGNIKEKNNARVYLGYVFSLRANIMAVAFGPPVIFCVSSISS